MEAASGDFEALFAAGPENAIHEAMVSGDPPRPPSGQISAERLRLTDPGKRCALDILDQGVDAPQDVPIRFEEMQIVSPSALGPKQLHSTSMMSCSTSLPASAWP